MKRLSILLPVLLSTVAVPAIAGDITVQPVTREPATSIRRVGAVYPNEDIFCRYTPIGAELNLFGPRAFITLADINGNSTISFEQPANDFNLTSATRSLTFADTSARNVERQLINQPSDYAALLGVSTNNPLVRRGFRAISEQFVCQPFDRAFNVTVSSQRTRPRLTEQISRQAVFSTEIAALPDGNYRYTTGTSDISANTDDSPIFTFRKLGNFITGNFDYPLSGSRACITGTIEGNTIIGQAFSNSTGTTILGQRYLGENLSLRFDDDFFSNDASLDLNGFNRINAGTTAPPSSCS